MYICNVAVLVDQIV